MRLHRFYIQTDLAKGKDVRIEDSELLHQCIKVFRLKAGNRIIVFNEKEKEFEGYFKILSKNEAVLAIDKKKENRNTLKAELHLFPSVIKKDNFEFLTQKCTEIGVRAFHPVISERSEKKGLNIERLQKIAKEASEQSGRVNLPDIFPPISLEEAVENFERKMYVLDFEGETFSKIPEKIGIFIGPEGGWTDKEREFFREKGISSISLGSLALRAETAAIAASAIILIR